MDADSESEEEETTSSMKIDFDDGLKTLDDLKKTNPELVRDKEGDDDSDFEELRDDFPWPEKPDPDWDPTKFSIDWRKDYLLADESWKYHTIPEIMDGKNIADFVDPDILAKLDALEQEEADRLALEETLQDLSEEQSLKLTPEERAIWNQIQERKIKIRKAHSQEKGHNAPPVPHKHIVGDADEFESHLNEIGLDPRAAVDRARKRSRSKSLVGREPSESQERGRSKSTERARSLSRGRSKTPQEEGFKNKKQKTIAENKKRSSERPRNKAARVGEADRAIITKMPKHLFSGKRKAGKTSRR